ncbi:MAG TPA: hypothetical protein PKM73_20055 [Verrucomicrobiota bacterium]|nr:hypothetical protein [Verrucomicrobiota bacterium]HNU50590.1 hypothetical protein [Verrucomicrobiota bacterium]
MNTTAMAANEWPWTYEADLLEPHPVRRVNVTFAANSYATTLHLSISADGKTLADRRFRRQPRWQAARVRNDQTRSGAVCSRERSQAGRPRLGPAKPAGTLDR